MIRPGKTRSLVRFALVWILLVSTAVLLNARSSFESVPQHQPLATFPKELNGWIGTDAPLAPDILELLGPGDFLNRTYTNPADPGPVSLYVAYYPSQRAGESTHSPQNCLPGAGWTALEMERINAAPAGTTSPAIVNRIVFGQGLNRVLVLYWFQSHGHITPSEYWNKFYLFRDAIATNRSDGGMVRLVTPISNASDEAQAETRLIRFAQFTLAKLDTYIPR
jgi:EpsI family protein